MKSRVAKIVSGGQTGVDRAALDTAIRLGIPCGGWCPRGRFAEDGQISPAYPLEETPSRDYAERTLWNVRDSDGTLVLGYGPPQGGTAYTIYCTKAEGRPCSIVDLAQNPKVADTALWLESQAIQVLNVAGPRNSTCPQIYALASRYLESLLTAR